SPRNPLWTFVQSQPSSSWAFRLPCYLPRSALHMTHLNIRSVAIVSTLALCIAVPAQAQRREARNPHQGSSAVLGEVGLFLPTQDGMTTGPAVEGAYEYYLTARNSLRLGVGWANPKLDREHSDGTRQIRGAGELVHNWEGGAVHPFVGAGVGSYFLQS